MDSNVLFHMFVFLAAACLMVPLASRFKLGSVLGYLAAGIAIGPFGTALIGNPEQIMHFAEFGVVMMLFLIGLELEPATLWRMRRSIVGLGSLQVVLTSVAFMGTAMALGFTWQVGLAIGMALSLSSTALVLQMLDERNLMHTTIGETSFAVLLFQDIAVIAILVILPLLASGAPAEIDAAHPSTWLEHLPGWAHALAVAGIIALVIASGRYLSHYVFRAVARTNLREIFTAASLCLVVGITLLMQRVGMSPALGAFIAGVVLANSHYKRTLETDIEPFKGLLLGLFFISVGMGMDFGIAAARPCQLLLTVIGLISLKAAILFFLASAFDLGRRHSIGFAIGLSQGSEFAFVLLRYAGNAHVMHTELADFLTLAVAISMAVTPLLILYYTRYIVPRFMSMLPLRDFDTIHEQNPVILAGYGRFGQIIGRFLSAQGFKLTILENDPDQIDTLRKFGFKGYFGDALRLDILKAAGVDKARLFIIAIGDADGCLELATLLREEFPHVTIYARARNRRHAYELHKIGVQYFKRDTFDSSLAMARKIMQFLGRSPEEARRKAQAFRRHDEKALRHSFAFFEREPELIDFARQASGELERLLQDDKAK